jgi:hypothetical protein
MADTGGIASLLKALNEQPALGSGLRTSAVSRPVGIARASNAVRSTSAAQTGSAALRAARTSLAAAQTGTAPLPKIASPAGKGYDPKAPKGSYVNLLI